jgi:hypothetical protein
MTAEESKLYHYQYGIEGDIWHRSLAEAVEQAPFQFGAPAEAWLPVPAQITDLPDFGRKNSN